MDLLVIFIDSYHFDMFLHTVVKTIFFCGIVFFTFLYFKKLIGKLWAYFRASKYVFACQCENCKFCGIEFFTILCFINHSANFRHFLRWYVFACHAKTISFVEWSYYLFIYLFYLLPKLGTFYNLTTCFCMLT
jgi:hypothetical protein